MGKISIIIKIGVLCLMIAFHTFAGKIGIIINKDLYPSIKASLDTYISDLKKIEKKDVWVEATKYSPTTKAEELRKELLERFTEDKIEGAIFIGDLPIASFGSKLSTTRAGYPCDLYFMDLNGIFGGSSSSLSSHSGDKAPEIWISRITASVLRRYKGFEDEVKAVNDYFKKVHKRMTGQDTMLRKYVIAGQKNNWKSLEKENIGDLDYESENIGKFSGEKCGPDWKREIIAGQEYGFVYSHSGPTHHAIGFKADDIIKYDVNTRFINSYACSNAKFTRANMCGLYALAKQGLVCVGSSKTGSMKPGSFRAYNKPLGQGKSFGEAFKIWYAEQGIKNKGWHYGMNLQGVGTLRVQPYNSTPIINGELNTTESNSHILRVYSNSVANRVNGIVTFTVKNTMNGSRYFLQIFDCRGNILYRITQEGNSLLEKKSDLVLTWNRITNNGKKIALGSYIASVTIIKGNTKIETLSTIFGVY